MMTSPLLHLIQDQFNLQLVQTRAPLVSPGLRPLSPFCQSMVEWGLECVTPHSNERTRCEAIVGQMMRDVAIDAEVSLFLGYPLEVDSQIGLIGVCDYLISRSPLTFRIHPPITLIVEVKRDLARALPHCLLELVAAQQLNASSQRIYGVLTTGLEWQFLQLEGNVVTLEQNVYELEPVERIAGILTSMVA